MMLGILDWLMKPSKNALFYCIFLVFGCKTCTMDNELEKQIKAMHTKGLSRIRVVKKHVKHPKNIESSLKVGLSVNTHPQTLRILLATVLTSYASLHGMNGDLRKSIITSSSINALSPQSLKNNQLTNQAPSETTTTTSMLQGPRIEQTEERAQFQLGYKKVKIGIQELQTATDYKSKLRAKSTIRDGIQKMQNANFLSNDTDIATLSSIYSDVPDSNNDLSMRCFNFTIRNFYDRIIPSTPVMVDFVGSYNPEKAKKLLQLEANAQQATALQKTAQLFHVGAERYTKLAETTNYDAKDTIHNIQTLMSDSIKYMQAEILSVKKDAQESNRVLILSSILEEIESLVQPTPEDIKRWQSNVDLVIEESLNIIDGKLTSVIEQSSTDILKKFQKKLESKPKPISKFHVSEPLPERQNINPETRFPHSSTYRYSEAVSLFKDHVSRLNDISRLKDKNVANSQLAALITNVALHINNSHCQEGDEYRKFKNFDITPAINFVPYHILGQLQGHNDALDIRIEADSKLAAAIEKAKKEKGSFKIPVVIQSPEQATKSSSSSSIDKSKISLLDLNLSSLSSLSSSNAEGTYGEGVSIFYGEEVQRREDEETSGKDRDDKQKKTVISAKAYREFLSKSAVILELFQDIKRYPKSPDSSIHEELLKRLWEAESLLEQIDQKSVHQNSLHNVTANMAWTNKRSSENMDHYEKVFSKIVEELMKAEKKQQSSTNNVITLGNYKLVAQHNTPQPSGLSVDDASPLQKHNQSASSSQTDKMPTTTTTIATTSNEAATTTPIVPKVVTKDPGKERDDKKKNTQKKDSSLAVTPQSQSLVVATPTLPLITPTDTVTTTTETTARVQEKTEAEKQFDALIENLTRSFDKPTATYIGLGYVKPIRPYDSFITNLPELAKLCKENEQIQTQLQKLPENVIRAIRDNLCTVAKYERTAFKKDCVAACYDLATYNPEAFDILGHAVNALKEGQKTPDGCLIKATESSRKHLQVIASAIGAKKIESETYKNATEEFANLNLSLCQLQVSNDGALEKYNSSLASNYLRINQALKAHHKSGMNEVLAYKDLRNQYEKTRAFKDWFASEVNKKEKQAHEKLTIELAQKFKILKKADAQALEHPNNSEAHKAFIELKDAQENKLLDNSEKYSLQKKLNLEFDKWKQQHPNAFQEKPTPAKSTSSWWNPFSWSWFGSSTQQSNASTTTPPISKVTPVEKPSQGIFGWLRSWFI